MILFWICSHSILSISQVFYENVLIDWNFTPYLALRDSAHNLIAAFDNEDCNFESTDDILHSLQTVVKKGVL